MTDDPGRVQKVILMTRQSVPATVNTAQNNGPGQGQPQAEEPQDEEMPPPEAEADNPPENPPPEMLGRFWPARFLCIRQVQMGSSGQRASRTAERLRNSCCRTCNIWSNNSSDQEQLNPANVEGQPHAVTIRAGY